MSGYLFLAKLFILFGSLFSIIYTFGVVWRVEKKLDLSFKLLLGAIISFTISEILSLFSPGKTDWLPILSIAFRVAFIILFLVGILEMRHMLRKLDGEIGNPSVEE